VTAYESVVVNGQVVLDGGVIQQANIGIRGGKVSAITDAAIDAGQRIDAGGAHVIPGLVDEHYHSWWGYGHDSHKVNTHAAARGGGTTLIEMPLDNPPTLSRALLERKMSQVADQYHVDHAAIGGYDVEHPDEVHAMVRGELIYAEGTVTGKPGYGQFVTKEPVP
jgi:dihydroorotase-like cyclic amidohydrolase